MSPRGEEGRHERGDRRANGRREDGHQQRGRRQQGGQGPRGRGERPGAGRNGGGGRPQRGGDRRSPRADPARLAAYEVLRRVADSDAYANLVLPGLLRERGVTGRDAAFATELAYGALRLRGRYDAVVERCLTGRDLASLDEEVLDLLRLGAHQLLGMRVPVHAAVSETVALTRAVLGPGPSGLVNAVLRTAAERPWLDTLGGPVTPEEYAADEDAALGRLATLESHPEWIVRALRQALLMERAHAGEVGGIAAAGSEASVLAELTELLRADNASPRPALVARPGLITPEELAGQARERTRSDVEPGRWSPHALIPAAGDPGRLPAVREARAGVQDEGSQVVALALVAAALSAPVAGSPADERWLDLCAGPGGKAALLGALAAERGARLLANEVAPHRAGLVRGAVAAVPEGGVEVRTGDGRDLGDEEPESFDRVLVDAPCTGLGALRRRPESRWRRSPADLGPLGRLQRELLASALDAARPGGVVAYVTCSPHVAETRLVVEDTTRRRKDVEVLDAAAALRQVCRQDPGLRGPYVQLWPHRHGTDAMFLALLRKT